jgi:hypothetical protein
MNDRSFEDHERRVVELKFFFFKTIHLTLYSGLSHFLKYPQFQLDCYLYHQNILINKFLDQILQQDQILDCKETVSSRVRNYKNKKNNFNY